MDTTEPWTKRRRRKAALDTPVTSRRSSGGSSDSSSVFELFSSSSSGASEDGQVQSANARICSRPTINAMKEDESRFKRYWRRWTTSQKATCCSVCCTSVLVLFSIFALGMMLSISPVYPWLWAQVVVSTFVGAILVILWRFRGRLAIESRTWNRLVIAMATFLFICFFNLVFAFTFALWPLIDQNSDLSVLIMGLPRQDGIAVAIRRPDAIGGERVSVWVSALESEMNWSRHTSAGLPTTDTDFMATVVVNGLLPATRYSLRLEEPSLSDATPYTFTTAPPDGPGTFTFAHGSCIQRSLWFDHSFLEEIIDEDSPAFFLMIGDLIYSDNFLYYGNSQSNFDLHYRALFASVAARRFFSRPVGYMFDDHEVKNNWIGNEDRDDDMVKNGLASWRHHVGNTNPNFYPADAALGTAPVDYFQYSYGDVGFFVLDTRRYRDAHAARTLGEQQWQRLSDWLSQNNSRFVFKFVVSPMAFSNNFPGVVESWGRLAQPDMQRLKDFLKSQRITGVVLLSGDTHTAAVFEHPGSLYEFCSSPLEAFNFPYAGEQERNSVRTVYYSGGKYQNVRMVFDVDTTVSPPSFKATLRTRGVRALWQQRFELQPEGVVEVK